MVRESSQGKWILSWILKKKNRIIQTCKELGKDYMPRLSWCMAHTRFSINICFIWVLLPFLPPHSLRSHPSPFEIFINTLQNILPMWRCAGDKPMSSHGQAVYVQLLGQKTRGKCCPGWWHGWNWDDLTPSLFVNWVKSSHHQSSRCGSMVNESD